MKVLVLVIVSFDKPEYHDMLAVWRERTNKMTDMPSTDVWFIQCKSDKEWIGDIINDLVGERSSPMTPPFLDKDRLESQSLSLKDRFELDVANKTLYVRGDECLIPGILHKTVEALSFFLGSGDPYDYVWRTNLSSVLDFAGLERFLSSTSISKALYAGYIGLGSLNNGSSTFFTSGAGFLMSRDVAMYLVENKEFLRWDLIDDVAIGALLEPRFGLMHLERCWVQSEHIVAEKDVFHFRCESYQHLRTVEFMRLASKWIASRFLEVDRVP
jgi:hypothetical protein